MEAVYKLGLLSHFVATDGEHIYKSTSVCHCKQGIVCLRCDTTPLSLPATHSKLLSKEPHASERSRKDRVRSSGEAAVPECSSEAGHSTATRSLPFALWGHYQNSNRSFGVSYTRSSILTRLKRRFGLAPDLSACPLDKIAHSALLRGGQRDLERRHTSHTRYCHSSASTLVLP